MSAVGTMAFEPSSEPCALYYEKTSPFGISERRRPGAAEAPERFQFFWHGPFSQWHSCRFTVDGIEYNCAEQYMMASKARLFGDTGAAEAIMKAGRPKDQKNLGRHVLNFDTAVWNENARRIVYEGNRAKFTQHPDLLAKLFATQGATLVEASPFDTVWGIGLKGSDPRALSRSTWRGRNWLGETLTYLREDLLRERTIGLENNRVQGPVPAGGVRGTTPALNLPADVGKAEPPSPLPSASVVGASSSPRREALDGVENRHSWPTDRRAIEVMGSRDSIPGGAGATPRRFSY